MSEAGGMDEVVLAFTGGTLDRADQIRCDPAALAAAFANPDARCIMLKDLAPVTQDGEIIRLPLPEGAHLAEYALLGVESEKPLFARLTGETSHGEAFRQTRWQDIGAISAAELALYGTARSLVDWHARHRFCAACGEVTHVVKGGWSRLCGGCGAEHFPRVDPVTIMLAEHDGRVLVGRQPRFNGRMYSALAGFVEPGETIEQAVARELHEEAGVRVGNVRYVMSQPWPFPSMLMIACLADAEDDALTIDTTELEDAKWVSADEVRAALRGDPDAVFEAPSYKAVAHQLLRYWLAQQE